MRFFIQPLKKRDGFEVLAATIAVGNPFSLLARIVEV